MVHLICIYRYSSLTSNGSPSVFTHPSPTTTSVRINDYSISDSITIRRRSLITAVKLIAAHQTWVAIVVTQSDSYCLLVFCRFLVGEDIAATSAMTSLVIMVVNKYKGILRGHHAPTWVIYVKHIP